MAVKSAPPTPMMIMDMGRREALTMAERVWSRSVITPSVMIRRTKYCLEEEGGEEDEEYELGYLRLESTIHVV